MKQAFITGIICITGWLGLHAQDTGFLGLYHAVIDKGTQFRIKRDQQQIILEVIGQGQVPMTAIGDGKYRVPQVSPPATISFIRDQAGTVDRFTWFQDRKGKEQEFMRVSVSAKDRGNSADSGDSPHSGNSTDSGDSPHVGNSTDSGDSPHVGNSRDSGNSPHSGDSPHSGNSADLSGLAGLRDSGGFRATGSEYAGQYRMPGNPYLLLTIAEAGQQLSVRKNDSDPWIFRPLGKDRYIFRNGEFSMRYTFVRDKQGRVVRLRDLEEGALDFVRTEEGQGEGPQEHAFNSRAHFTRADTIRGMLTPMRSCYDVVFYGLDLAVDPATKSIRGSTELRFRAVQDFDSIQIDLFAGIAIDKILCRGRSLRFRREHGAVYVFMTDRVRQGAVDTLLFFIAGKPQEPNFSALAGGFIWWHDKNGNPWIESVCQGSGASLWWPCKDHLSDKPDSMSIRITVPDSLMDISNGRLAAKVPLPNGLSRWEWVVDYPINNYNVVVNIGKYTAWSEPFVRNGDTLLLHYYCMPANLEKAKQVFRDLRPMLTAYERRFGPYPFPRDGLTVLESLYPMEHQGAVSIGSINNPVDGDQWDPADLQHSLFHETAHEWWGNSVTCRDYADFWIHESFTAYAELTAYEAIAGLAAVQKILRDQHPDNKEPIIGHYDVNDFHLGDMYPKGCLMLNTLRHVIDDDSLWFSLLRGIQSEFRYQSVTTADIVAYVNRHCRKDYTSFFDQYLRHAELLALVIRVSGEDGDCRIRYRWEHVVADFNMRVKVSTAPAQFGFIDPGETWHTLVIRNMKPENFRVDTDNFYINVVTVMPQ